jgi:hypothetical protein
MRKKNGRDVRLSSKVDRRRFLKYVGSGLVAGTIGGAGYYLYSKQAGYAPSETITTAKGWETTSTFLTSSLARTTTTLPKGEWWKNTKVATAGVDYWTAEGKQYVEGARIELIDYIAGQVVGLTPALRDIKGYRALVDEAHSKGVMVRAYEAPFLTYHQQDYIFVDGEIWRASDVSGNIVVGEKVRYPLRALYQSNHWSRYFAEKWRNPDDSVMDDPIEGGAARNVKYEILDDPTWNVTVMSTHNPKYLEYVKKCLEVDVDAGFDGLSLDFMNLPPFAWWLGGDFSPWAEHKFKAYLSETYAQEELKRMSISKVEQGLL